MKRILFAKILVLVSATLFGCGGVEPMGGDTSESPAGAEAASHGISFYRVERFGNEADVDFLNSRREVIGGLHVRTPRPGVVQLDDTIDGMIAAFEVDTGSSRAALTVSSGGQKATVFQDFGDDVTGDASARALFEQQKPLWNLARSVYVELGLDRELLNHVQERLSSEPPVSEMSTVRAMDGICPNFCKANGCYFFWNQYTHTLTLPDGNCYVFVSGCGC